MAQESALLAKSNLVDVREVSFVETGVDRADSWDVEWEVTPAPIERAHSPGAAQAHPVSAASDDGLDEPTPMPPLRDPERDVRQAPRARDATPLPPPPPDLDPHRTDPHTGRDASSFIEALPRVFIGVRADVLLRSLEHFDVLDVYAGETLIEQGERHPALVMVLRGSVEADRHGAGHRVSRGEVLGMTTLFGSGNWPMKLSAVTDCRLLVLELEGFRTLRGEGSVVAQAIEEYALEMLLQAYERVGVEVRERVQGKPLKALLPLPGFLARCAAAIGGGGVAPVRIDATAAMLVSPLFHNATTEHLIGFEERVAGIKAAPGEFLITQGEPSTLMYMVAKGTVDVITAMGDRGAVHHETLGPGDMFGVWSMLRSTASWASYVVMTKATLVEIEKVDWVDMAVAGDSRGAVLRLALLRSLTGRLTSATALVAALRSGRRPESVDHGSPRSPFISMHPVSRR